MAESPPATDGLGLAELTLRAYEKITQRDAEIAPLREENARLKGLKGRPHCLHPRAESVGDGDHSPRSPHRKEFCRSSAWMARLKELGITALKVNPDPVRISTEGAIRGSIATQGLLDGTVIVSDGAGQFDICRPRRCWIHAERLVHK